MKQFQKSIKTYIYIYIYIFVYKAQRHWERTEEIKINCIYKAQLSVTLIEKNKKKKTLTYIYIYIVEEKCEKKNKIK